VKKIGNEYNLTELLGLSSEAWRLSLEKHWWWQWHYFATCLIAFNLGDLLCIMHTRKMYGSLLLQGLPIMQLYI